MTKVLWIYLVLMLVGLGVIGCAAADAFFNRGQDGKSQAEKVGESLTGLPPPWNEIIPGLILTVQNGYLLVRKGQAAAKTRKSKKSDTSKPQSEPSLPA